jgi:hypothetical protein
MRVRITFDHSRLLHDNLISVQHFQIHCSCPFFKHRKPLTRLNEHEIGAVLRLCLRKHISTANSFGQLKHRRSPIGRRIGPRAAAIN